MACVQSLWFARHRNWKFFITNIIVIIRIVAPWCYESAVPTADECLATWCKRSSDRRLRSACSQVVVGVSRVPIRITRSSVQVHKHHNNADVFAILPMHSHASMRSRIDGTIHHTFAPSPILNIFAATLQHCRTLCWCWPWDKATHRRNGFFLKPRTWCKYEYTA